MIALMPRTLYAIAVIACVLLVWPNPITIFLAACFSCLTLPIYRRLRLRATRWRHEIESTMPKGRMRSFLTRVCAHFPILSYASFVVLSLFLPVAMLLLLVAPQAASGLARLRELRDSNFQVPPHWLEYFQAIKRSLAEYPNIEKAFNDAISNIDSMTTDAVGMLVSRSFGFVGSTFNVAWLVLLFLMLTVIFTRYSLAIRKISCRILQLPHTLLHRFALAIHMALRGIMLGIVLVALVQGILCGIGFAVAGVNQPAFWGLLATMVAPIPMIGTALVWFPLCLSLWFTGKTVAAIGLALWGTLFVAGVDNVLRPFFLRQGIKAPFVVLILVILCGLSSFGAVGLIAGPVLLALAMQSLEEAAKYYRR